MKPTNLTEALAPYCYHSFPIGYNDSICDTCGITESELVRKLIEAGVKSFCGVIDRDAIPKGLAESIVGWKKI